MFRAAEATGSEVSSLAGICSTRLRRRRTSATVALRGSCGRSARGEAEADRGNVVVRLETVRRVAHC